jgi:fibronectin-binding autotransporter adhesin
LSITVSSGVTSSGLTISSGDPLVVLAGGTVEHTSIASGATASLSSGAVAVNLMVSKGGVVQGQGELDASFVAGSMSGVSIGDGGSELLPGGTASNVEVGENVGVGWFSTLDIQGAVTGLQVTAAGTINVFAGGVASNADVDGSLFLSGGTLRDVTIESGGTLSMSSGVATDTTVQSGGTLNIFAVTTDITLETSVTSAMLVSGVTVSSGGHVVLVGGTIASGATLSLGSGVSVSGALVDKGAVVLGPGGFANVRVSGAVNGVADTGYMEVESGGTASGVTVDASANPDSPIVLSVESGASVTATVLQDDTGLNVYRGATATATIVGDGAAEDDLGSVSGDVVRSGGELLVLGQASDETVQSGGSVQFDDTVTTSVVAGVAAAAATLNGVTVSSGGIIELGTVIVTDGATVSLGGSVAEDLTVSSGAVIKGPGIADDVEVLSGGAVSGLTAYAATIASGGSGTDTVISGNSNNETVFGSATGDTVLNGAFLYLESGGRATDETVQSGGTVVFGEDVTNNFTLAAGAVKSTTVLAGVTISSGGDVAVTGATVVNGVTLTLAAAAVADNVTVAAGGSVLGPGMLGGFSYVAGRASGVTLGGPRPIYLELLSGGTASAVTVSGYLNAMQIDADASATGTVLAGDARLGVFGSAAATHIEASFEAVYAGGLTSGDFISGEGKLYVSAGGAASGGMISSGGAEVVSSGGFAGGTKVLSGGKLYLLAGTTTAAQVSAGGKAAVSSGGVASATTVLAGGALYVVSSGATRGTQVSAGGHEVVSSGGVASGTTVLSGGVEYVLSGGVDYNTAVAGGGKELVSLGGAVFGLSLNSGGEVIDNGEVRIAGAGTLAGIMLGSGAVVETGGGDLLLSSYADRDFAGRVAIEGGTVELGTRGAIGSGYVEFVEPSTGSAVLQIDADDAPKAGGTFANTIDNFDGAGEAIDLRSIAFVAGASATVVGSTLLLTDGGKTYTFDIAGSTAGAYPILSDGHGGTLIDPRAATLTQAMAAFTPPSAAATPVARASSSAETPFLHAAASASAGHL